MKKGLYTMAFGLLMSYMGYAQPTIYEGVRLTNTDLLGTARYIGMGGAMGALGGDISSISTNPASIGLYRKGEFSFSLGFDNKTNNGVNRSKVFVENIGYVYSMPIGSYKTDKFLNFAFNYRRSKDFNRKTNFNGNMSNSISLMMADMLNGYVKSPYNLEEIDRQDAYDNVKLPWLGLLGHYGNLIGVINGTNEYGSIYTMPGFGAAGDNTNMSYTSNEKGSVKGYDLNVSFNINNMFYIGATLGNNKVDYRRESKYSEEIYSKDNAHKGGYDLINQYSMQGDGVDFKLGFILRPLEESSFRFGLAVHSPTLYNLYERSTVDLDSGIKGHNAVVIKPRNKYGEVKDYVETEYTIITPWKLNFSLGGVVLNKVALGAEYEYADNSTTDIQHPNGDSMHADKYAKEMLKPSHTIKLGAEVKLSKRWSARAGYNFVSTSTNNEVAYKKLQDNSARTDAEYENFNNFSRYTLGLGYRSRSFFFDAAYQYSHINGEFFPFESKLMTQGYGFSSRNNNSRLTITIGTRF